MRTHARPPGEQEGAHARNAWSFVGLIVMSWSGRGAPARGNALARARVVVFRPAEVPVARARQGMANSLAEARVQARTFRTAHATPARATSPRRSLRREHVAARRHSRARDGPRAGYPTPQAVRPARA